MSSAGNVPSRRPSRYLDRSERTMGRTNASYLKEIMESGFENAMESMKRLRLISKSDERDRRPTLAELDRLMEHFAARRLDSAPMQKIVAFAIFSTRRQEEITRLQWDDPDGDRILVRAMKDPKNKQHNNVRCELTPEALQIINSMPRVARETFPFTAEAISSAFTKACDILWIADLHFHDLRHEGISRLFEMGRTIPQVAAVSGHRSWSSLKRYTHIRKSGDKYAGWIWLSHLTLLSRQLSIVPTPRPWIC